MISRLAASVKRLRFGHYSLIFMLALVMLLVGLVLKGYIPLPTPWAQQLPFLSTTRPTMVAQAQQPGETSTDQAAAIVVDTTPTISRPIATSTGITTVITLTPTITDVAPAHTPQSLSVEEQATIAPATPTAPSPVELQPTSNFTADASAALGQIRSDMQDLSRIMRATRVLLKTFNHEQPTEEELAAIRAQLTVIAQRMSRLAAQIQAAQDGLVLSLAATATPAANASISPEQMRDLLFQMQEALEVLRGVLTDPSTDSATLVQAQEILSQFEMMLEQVRVLTESMQMND